MIAHLENGTALNLSPTAATIGLRVVRWGFDFNDMRELLKNPELLGILATRMPPVSRKVDEAVNAMSQRTWVGLTDEEIKPCWYEACQTDLELTSQLVVYFAKAIEAKLKEKNT